MRTCPTTCATRLKANLPQSELRVFADAKLLASIERLGIMEVASDVSNASRWTI